jgi:hypothetical protein
MSSKKKAAITDRATAKKAKAYIYGVKEIRQLEAVKKRQLYLESSDSTSTKDEEPKRNAFYINITSALTVVVRLTLFFLYLYMLWSFMNM